MEQAASGALSSLLAQLGIFGIGLALLLIPIVREQRDQIAALTRRLDNIEGGSHEA